MAIPERFRDMASAYGARRDRWPEPERSLYDNWSASPEGEQILAEAEQLDRCLDQLRVDDFDVTRMSSAVMASLAAPVSQGFPRWFSAGLCASVLLGLALGFGPLSGPTDIEAQLELSSIAFGDYAYEEYQDL